MAIGSGQGPGASAEVEATTVVAGAGAATEASGATVLVGVLRAGAAVPIGLLDATTVLVGMDEEEVVVGRGSGAASA